jgi:hypothetical protein
VLDYKKFDGNDAFGEGEDELAVTQHMGCIGVLSMIHVYYHSSLSEFHHLIESFIAY